MKTYRIKCDFGKAHYPEVHQEIDIRSGDAVLIFLDEDLPNEGTELQIERNDHSSCFEGIQIINNQCIIPEGMLKIMGKESKAWLQVNSETSQTTVHELLFRIIGDIDE